MHTSEALRLYTSHLTAAGMRPATVRLRRHQLAHFFAQVAPRRVESIKAEHIEDWVAVHEWAPNTARSYRAALRGFFKWCKQSGYVTESPARKLRPGPAPRPNPRPVDDAAYDFAMQVADPRQRLMLRLAAETGLRRGEVAQGSSDDMFEDLDGWSLVVHGKGGKVRNVPLKDDLAWELHALPAGYFFPGPNGHLSAAHVGVLVRRLLPERYSMHKLRTRFGTRAYAATHDLRAVQELLGHASPATTQAYVQVTPRSMRDAVNAV